MNGIENLCLIKQLKMDILIQIVMINFKSLEEQCIDGDNLNELSSNICLNLLGLRGIRSKNIDSRNKSFITDEYE